MNIIVVDTDILIDLANKDRIATARIQEEALRTKLAVSTITVMELLVGCRNKQELTATNRFLSKFQIVELNASISHKARQLLETYYLSHGLLIPDALIAATAIENQLSLLTKNQRDFRFIETLNLLPYP